MTSILLPDLASATMSPSVVTFDGVLTPPLGGEEQQVNRLGARYAIEFGLPPMRAASAEGRAWVARMTQALRAEARFFLPLDGLDVGAPGQPVVAAATASLATSLPLSGLTPNYVLRVGQWLTLGRGTYRRLHMVAARAIASAAGVATVELTLPLRASQVAGDVVEIRRPSIEGRLTSGAKWSSGTDRWLAAPSFTIGEKR